MAEDPSRGSSYSPGSVIKANSLSREASMITVGTTGSVVYHGGTQTGSVVVKQDGSMIISKGGSMVVTHGPAAGGSVVISHMSDLANQFGSMIISK